MPFFPLGLLHPPGLFRQQIPKLQIGLAESIHFVRLDMIPDEVHQFSAPLGLLDLVLAQVICNIDRRTASQILRTTHIV